MTKEQVLDAILRSIMNDISETMVRVDEIAKRHNLTPAAVTSAVVTAGFKTAELAVEALLEANGQKATHAQFLHLAQLYLEKEAPSPSEAASSGALQTVH